MDSETLGLVISIIICVIGLTSMIVWWMVKAKRNGKKNMRFMDLVRKNVDRSELTNLFIMTIITIFTVMLLYSIKSLSVVENSVQDSMWEAFINGLTVFLCSGIFIYYVVSRQSKARKRKNA
jgi:formate hydrogenlyase subunit 3/multisubunit Na+/H+ antiporter MnhD subunit